MEIQNIKVELVDEDSRLVLKKMITNEGEFFNMIIAVSKQIYNYERKRENYNNSIFNNPFQTFHIMWNDKEEEWIPTGMEKAKEHAKKNKRFFIPYKQRKESQWNKLTWEEAEEEFKEFLGKTEIVPYPIPIRASLEEWGKKKEEALKLLKPSQQLMAIISSKHLNMDEFPKLVKEELRNSFFLGICCYRLGTSLEINNLSVLNSINSSQKEGEKTAFIIYFDFQRMLMNLSNISGSFAYSLFAGDVFSEKAYFPQKMSYESRDNMLNKKLKDYYLYNPEQKKYSKSISQKQWYGFDVVKNILQKISAIEGLNGYQLVKWINHYLEQRDLNFINKLLIENKEIVKTIRNYAGWCVFWDTKVKPNSSIIQRTLDLK